MNWHETAELLGATMRRFGRWMVWSPRRLAGVVAGVLLVTYVWSSLGPETPDREEQNQRVQTGLPEGWEEWPVVTATGAAVSDTSAALPSESTSTGEPTATSGPVEPVEDLSEETGTDNHDHDHDAGTSEVISKLAKDFATTYVSGAPNEEWLKDLAELTSPQLADEFTTVDQENIVPTAIKSIEVVGFGEFAATANALTDAGVMVIEMAYDGERWNVVRVTPPSGVE